MFDRLSICTLALAWTLLAGCHPRAPVSVDGGTDASAPARDWSISPAIAQVDGAPELWVLSDIHADYDALTKLLGGAGLIAASPSAPADVEWQAGSAVLVVVGDLIDKGPDAPDVIRLLMALQTAAAAAGGQVIVTMGNHEAEFLADPENSDATKTGTEEGVDPELADAGLTPAETADGEDAIGVFLRALPIAARVDDWFFAHAGNTGGVSLDALTSSIEDGFADGGFGADVFIGDDSILEARLSSSPPQWWDATGDAMSLLSQWTAALGVSHLVMGHQPGKVGFADGGMRSKDQMYAAYGGLLFLVDTGMSVGVDDTGGALLHVTHVGSSDESWEEVLPDGSMVSL